MKRNALGRGLDSLIPMDDAPAQGASAISEIRIDAIQANPDQPRRIFDEEALQELARSIGELGIVQPLSVRAVGPDSYQIIAGERRWRAAQLAGLTTVPAYVRKASDMEVTEMALIENIQREDLNPIEISLAYKKLMDEYGLTQERLSVRLGKNRPTIANYLRLLNLPADVQLGLRDKRVDVGHARALITLGDPKLQIRLYNMIVKEGLSVRKVEALAKAWRENPPTVSGAKSPAADSDNALARQLRNIGANLTTRLGLPVDLKCRQDGAGKLTVTFKSSDELAALIELLDTVKN